MQSYYNKYLLYWNLIISSVVDRKYTMRAIKGGYWHTQGRTLRPFSIDPVITSCSRKANFTENMLRSVSIAPG